MSLYLLAELHVLALEAVQKLLCAVHTLGPLSLFVLDDARVFLEGDLFIFIAFWFLTHYYWLGQAHYDLRYQNR